MEDSQADQPEPGDDPDAEQLFAEPPANVPTDAERADAEKKTPPSESPAEDEAPRPFQLEPVEYALTEPTPEEDTEDDFASVPAGPMEEVTFDEDRPRHRGRRRERRRGDRGGRRGRAPRVEQPVAPSAAPAPAPGFRVPAWVWYAVAAVALVTLLGLMAWRLFR